MNRREWIAGCAAFSLGLPFAGATRSSDMSQAIVPPEEAPHDRTFMQWPVSLTVYRDRYFLALAQETIADIANAVSAFEPVTLLAARDHHDTIREKVSAAVTLWDIPTEDLWCRDSGPLFAKTPQGGLVVSHIQFNGWGNRQIHRSDGQVAVRVAARLGLPVVASGLKGEPGGVEHDGHGRLMAHESSWVHDNRNPGMGRAEIETRLLRAYGAGQMTWAPGLRDKDITDYHIDALARFTGPGRVLMNLPGKPDAGDPFHQASLETRDRLVGAGLKVDIIPEPVFRRVRSADFVASYVNYYVCNGAVIAAEFGDRETDAIAVDALRKHYPGREIVTLNVDALGEFGGGIHCATQQMPAVE